MIKLITPPGLLLTVALLAIYSAYAFLIGHIERSLPLALAGVVTVVACIGTALMKPWSRFLVYLLTTGFVYKFIHSVYAGMVSGYFGFQFGSPLEALWSLAPGFAMALLSCVCAFLVFKHFQRARRVVA